MDKQLIQKVQKLVLIKNEVIRKIQEYEKENGCKILDHIGTQCHTSINDIEGFRQSIEELQQFGLPIDITELDISKGLDGANYETATPEELATIRKYEQKLQNDIMKLISKFAKEGKIRSVTSWSITDELCCDFVMEKKHLLLECLTIVKNEYEFYYDNSKTFEEQELLDDTKYILFGLFEKFGITELQKEKIKTFRNSYYNQLEEEKRERYNQMIYLKMQIKMIGEIIMRKILITMLIIILILTCTFTPECFANTTTNTLDESYISINMTDLHHIENEPLSGSTISPCTIIGALVYIFHILLTIISLIIFIIGIVKILLKKKGKKYIISSIIVFIINYFITGLIQVTKSFKPIIYLYPEKEEKIEVKLLKAEKLTSTYPKYNKSWQVLAKPNGTLINLENKRELYSLYWEGRNNVKHNIKEGFIVEGKDVCKFLEKKLSILGLNDKEAEEFIIYWLPKLEENKYNFIRFETEEEINNDMPLEIKPKPDTIIRVMMAYKKILLPYEVKEQHLEKVERKGFTVVEWGGTKI